MSDIDWSAVGLRIVAVRPVKNNPFDYGHDMITALVLSDGSEIFASCDAEGNGPGELFANLPNGDEIMIYTAKVLKEV
jgi:hypothetical protein